MHTYERILGAVARGWCSEENKHKVMDTDLAIAIAKEVYKEIMSIPTLEKTT